MACTVGGSVGLGERFGDGIFIGPGVGCIVGSWVGSGVGSTEGLPVGSGVGTLVAGGVNGAGVIRFVGCTIG